MAFIAVRATDFYGYLELRPGRLGVADDEDEQIKTDLEAGLIERVTDEQLGEHHPLNSANLQEQLG